MSIEKKTGLPYELMIRFCWDPQTPGKKLGDVMTYMFQSGTALVDTGTNTLAAPYAPDPAVDLTKEQAVAFLGTKFAGFLEQLSDAQKRCAAMENERDAALDQAKVEKARADGLAAALADDLTRAQERIRELRA